MAYEVLLGGSGPAGERAHLAMWDVTTALDSGSGSVAVLIARSGDGAENAPDQASRTAMLRQVALDVAMSSDDPPPAPDERRRRDADAVAELLVAAAAVGPASDGRADLAHHALVQAVEECKPWQVPWALERVLGDPRLSRVLAEVADGVLGWPEVAWWSAPIIGRAQVEVEPVLAGADPWLRTAAEGRDALARWSAATPADPVGAPRDPEPRRQSGSWWSAPIVFPRLPSTVGLDPVRGPAGLWYVEDSLGPERAEVHEARVLPGARVLELGCAADWAALVAAHPRVVTATRQDDWFASTGRRGPWVIPDWQAVADRWDGVHLQVRGYLDAAGRAVPVPAAPGVPDGAATVLAGWSPDETWWLHPEAVERTGVAATWVRTQEDWAPLG